MSNAAHETGYAEVTDARLYYEIAGEGDPLVFVHAGIADSRMWDQQFEVFAQHYRVVRYDMRGFGKSSTVAADFAHRQDLSALLTYLDIERAYCVGCSMGGTMLIDFTLENPGRVMALVTSGSRPNGFVRESTYIPPQWDDIVASFKAGDIERASELEVQVWVDGPHRTPDQVDAGVRKLVWEMNLIALNNEKDEKGSNIALEPPAATRMSEISVPMLAITGDLDDADVVRAADVMAQTVPNAQKVVISNTAHVPNMEKPDEFNRIVLNFLQSLK